jgi:hypothetical protein
VEKEKRNFFLKKGEKMKVEDRRKLQAQIASQLYATQLAKITVWEWQSFKEGEEGFSSMKLAKFCADCADEILEFCFLPETDKQRLADKRYMEECRLKGIEKMKKEEEKHREEYLKKQKELVEKDPKYKKAFEAIRVRQEKEKDPEFRKAFEAIRVRQQKDGMKIH